jgi:hypothetical protein
MAKTRNIVVTIERHVDDFEDLADQNVGDPQ